MESSTPSGLLGALRTFGDNLLAGLQVRCELLSVELQEEKFRLLRLFLWSLAVAFTGLLAVLFASLAVVYLFWENARLAVLGGFVLLYGTTCLALFLTLRRYLARQPRPFAGTLRELSEDRTCTRTRN